ncbi:MAG TPA: hypothetical protein DCM71_28210 [Runella sp.]|jgi:hypothetical protein|nr:hypothetical protein [Runella sp.]
MPQLPETLKTGLSKQKKAESQTPSAISEMDFDDETLNRRVSTYQTSIKPKPQQAVKVKSEKVFHIGLKLDEQFRSEWLQIKYSLALRHGVEISMQKYVEFLHAKAVEKSESDDFLAEMADYFQAKTQ